MGVAVGVWVGVDVGVAAGRRGRGVGWDWGRRGGEGDRLLAIRRHLHLDGQLGVDRETIRKRIA